MSSTELWDEWNRYSAPRYPHNKLIQFMFRNYKANRNLIRVLDLGCGSGVNTGFLCEAGFDVYATDFSVVAVENTKELLKHNGLKCSEIRCEKISELSFPDCFFDCIVSVGVFESAGQDETAKCIPQIKRCLKNGGMGFFLFAAHDDFRMYNNYMNLHGYTEVEIRKIFGDYFPDFQMDHYITTFNNQALKEHNFIITIQK